MQAIATLTAEPELDSSMPDSMVTSPLALPDLQHIMQGYKNFQVLHSAVECGLFDWLDTHGPAHKSDLVTALGLRGMHSGAWLQCLVELGCLATHDGQYALHPGWRDLLRRSGAWSATAQVQELAQAGGRWSALADFMREDRHTAVRPPASLSGPQDGHALHPFRADAQALVQRLVRHPRAGTVKNILCFDASAGVFAALLARELTPARLHAVVPPEQMDAARARLCAMPSCTLQSGSPMDFAADGHTGGQFDWVILFHSLYAVRRTTNDALANVAAKLAPGGVLCAAHWFCLQACEPAPGGLNQLEQAVLTDFHPMCHIEAFCERFAPLGLVDAVKEDMQGEYGTVKLHFAVKP